ncbi:MAG: Ig-like domain-containing protein [Candidatus Marinimicrobia bacterium]|nr:Ig-like domain-containing protein [Candidatus Neomarinimicrobiota bacterium]
MHKFKQACLPALILLTLIWNCANERPISGGPVDKEAPQIIHSIPENETVNVNPNTDILIKFNEQMKKATFASSLQIWPRPPGGYEIKSGWTWLKVKFNEPLDSNETYLLTLDKDAQDLQGNGLKSTYVMAFSTGNSLNSGRITGRIHGPASLKKNGDLLLYRQFDTSLDKLRQTDADYVFQSDDTGNFELPYLAERSYMLFYHWDRNKNKRIDGDDYFGRPEMASVQARADSLQKDNRIWPQLIALKQLKLLGVNQLGEQFIEIRANRPITKKATQKLDLYIDDIDIPILGATPVDEDKFAMHVNIASPAREGASVWLQNFQDTSGFMLRSDTLKLKIPASFDTLALAIPKVLWANETIRRYPDESSEIHILASLPLIFRSDSAFKLVDSKVDSVAIHGNLTKISSMEWVFKPDSALKAGLSFLWQIEGRFLHSQLISRKIDSLMTGRLNTINADSLGSVRVIHMGVQEIYCTLSGKGVERQFKLVPGSSTVITDLPARTYSLSAFLDRDGDGLYSSGGLGPAAPSESFWIYNSEIKVRARWETDLGIWRLTD